MPVLRESRVVRHGTVKPEPAEPAVRQVQVNFLAQPPLRAYAEAIADDQHPNHQLRINGRPTNLTVKRRQLAPYPVKFDKAVNRIAVDAPLAHDARARTRKTELPDRSDVPPSSTALQSPGWIESAPPCPDNSGLFQHNRAQCCCPLSNLAQR